MLDKIAPGSKITVKIVKTPTNAAAGKTLQRILAKDPVFRAEDNRQAKIRKVHYNPRMRGGRLYGGRVVKQPAVLGRAGETGTITATLDVLRDLGSVQRFIEVTPA
ncbi:MAG: hypothetical protein Kow00105_09670 [Phycisphaeraceae bacterium]